MTVVQPDSSITIPGVTEAIAEPSVLRMEIVASRLKNLAITFTVFGAIGAMFGLMQAASGGGSAETVGGMMQVLVCLMSIIPFWIVYGFAWAFADFRVTAN